MPTPDGLRRSLWATVAFLLGFAGLITILSKYFLIPGLDAAADATAPEKRQLSAFALLLLAIVLLLLVVGLLMTFRVSRFFTARSPRTQTKYVDAWAESARRLDVDREQPKR